MRLATDEFIRRFLIHVLPHGFHRIRHYGLLASATRKANIAKIRALLGTAHAAEPSKPADLVPLTLREPCPCCGGPALSTKYTSPHPRAAERSRSADGKPNGGLRLSYTINRKIDGVSFEEAVARTRSALANQGFGVLTEIDAKTQENPAKASAGVTSSLSASADR